MFLDAGLQQAFQWGWEAREKLFKSGFAPEGCNGFEKKLPTWRVPEEEE